MISLNIEKTLGFISKENVFAYEAQVKACLLSVFWRLYTRRYLILSIFHHSFICKIMKEVQTDKCLPIRGDVFKFINSGREQFDFIFADPPYALKELESIPELIFKNNLLKEGGLFVLEHGKQNNFEENPHFIERRVYGSVNFSLFR